MGGYLHALLVQEGVAFTGGGGGFGPAPFDFPNPSTDVATLGLGAFRIHGDGLPLPALGGQNAMLTIETENDVLGNNAIAIFNRATANSAMVCKIADNGQTIWFAEVAGVISTLEFGIDFAGILSPGSVALFGGGASGGGAYISGGANIGGQGIHIGITGDKLSFFNNAANAPVIKQTVAGAKGGNAALTSLMAALVAYGFVIDTTT